MVVESVLPWEVYELCQDYCPAPFEFIKGQLVQIVFWVDGDRIAFKAQGSWEVTIATNTSLLSALNGANATMVIED